MVRTNTDLLKSWIKDEKKRNPHVRADLVKKARISPSYLEKILAGRVPSPQTQFMLAHATGLDERELFPMSESEAA